MLRLLGNMRPFSERFLLTILFFLLISPAICRAAVVCPTVVTSVSPNIWTAGKSYNITVNGTGFAYSPTSDCWFAGASLWIITNDIGSVTLSNVNYVSDTEITATATPDIGDPNETACVGVAELVVGVVRAPG